MTSTKAFLASLAAAAFVMLGGCGQSNDTGAQSDAPMSDTAPGTPSEPGTAGDSGSTMGTPDQDAGGAYGTGDDYATPGGATDPTMQDPSATDPNATSTPPADQSGSTTPEQ